MFKPDRFSGLDPQNQSYVLKIKTIRIKFVNFIIKSQLTNFLKEYLCEIFLAQLGAGVPP